MCLAVVLLVLAMSTHHAWPWRVNVRSAAVASVASGILTTFSIMPAARAQPQPQPQSLIKEGMSSFQKGDLSGSLAYFDKARESDPRIYPYLWQRGLTQYYLEDFSGCAEQFRADLAVNPNDSEEIIWEFLCTAKKGAVTATDMAKLDLLQRDRRAIMQVVKNVFSGAAPPTALDEYSNGNGASASASASSSDKFYGNLYLSLFYESKGKATAFRASYRVSSNISSPQEQVIKIQYLR